MYFKQFYLGCLAHASYLVGSEGEAAVVDPQRDVEQYVDEAEAHGLRIKYVIETHLHADFVSGHRELAARTGAEIVFGARAGASSRTAPSPTATSRAWEGPPPHSRDAGPHAREHLDPGIDTEVRRPAEGPHRRHALHRRRRPTGPRRGEGLHAEEMAGMLYETLHDKLLRSPMRSRSIRRTARARCAGATSRTRRPRPSASSAGRTTRCSRWRRRSSCDDDDRPAAGAALLLADAEINRTGAAPLAALARPAALGPEEVDDSPGRGRWYSTFASGASARATFPARSTSASAGSSLRGVASLIPSGTPIVLVAGTTRRSRSRDRLARVGHESVGYLDGGIAAWDAAGLATMLLPQIPVDELRAQIDERRGPPDYRRAQAGRVRLRPRAGGDQRAARASGRARLRVRSDTPTAVVCAGGYRSASREPPPAAGFADLFNVVGGTSAWVSAGYATET